MSVFDQIEALAEQVFGEETSRSLHSIPEETSCLEDTPIRTSGPVKPSPAA